MRTVYHLLYNEIGRKPYILCGHGKSIYNPDLSKSEEEFEVLPNEYKCKTCLRVLVGKNSTDPKIIHKRKRERVYYMKNKKSVHGGQKRLYNKLKKETPLAIVLKTNRIRSRANNRVFEITYTDLINQLEKQKGLCYYTNIPMIIEVTTKSPYQVSIDRKDSNLGYTVDNTVLCCQSINFAKSYFTEEVFLNFINDIVKCNAEYYHKERLREDLSIMDD